jgi:hypothetical protein
MGILSSISEMLNDFWDSVTELLDDLFDQLKKVLVVVLIVLAIIFMPGVGLALGIGFVGGGSWIVAALLLVGAFLVDPEFAAEIIGAIGDALKEVVDVLTEVASGLISTVAKGLGLPLLLGGAAVLYFLTRKPSTPSQPVIIRGDE